MLLARCNQARANGQDFAAIWHDFLKQDPLILGLPSQGLANGEPVLRIRLLTGQHLCCGYGGFFLE
jgi:hypothetical protein